jgi:hypothetical protein
MRIGAAVGGSGPFSYTGPVGQAALYLPKRQDNLSVRVDPERLAGKSKFAGLGDETDLVIGNRSLVLGGEGSIAAIENFNPPQPNGLHRRITDLAPLVTVSGGCFFLPGVEALRYLSGTTPLSPHN